MQRNGSAYTDGTFENQKHIQDSHSVTAISKTKLRINFKTAECMLLIW